jgi:hypothetical protein
VEVEVSRIAFNAALGRIRRLYSEDYIVTEIVDVDQMKTDEKYRFSPTKFIDWLLRADNAIVGHMHQVSAL